MIRNEKRKQERMLAKIVKNAKIDMQRWIDTLSEAPTRKEAEAFKAGYISGINRASGKADN